MQWIGRIEKVDFRSTTILFDGMFLDTFLIVSRIEFVVSVFVFVLFLGAFDTREGVGQAKVS